jgi:hypothetical protein
MGPPQSPQECCLITPHPSSAAGWKGRFTPNSVSKPRTGALHLLVFHRKPRLKRAFTRFQEHDQLTRSLWIETFLLLAPDSFVQPYEIRRRGMALRTVPVPLYTRVAIKPFQVRIYETALRRGLHEFIVDLLRDIKILVDRAGVKKDLKSAAGRIITDFGYV